MVFEIKGVELHLTVYNRSNDLIYGNVTGANPVHFSFFQQWVANKLDIPMGPLTFISTNAHVYTDNPIWQTMDFAAPINIRSLELPLGELDEIEELCDLIMERKIIRTEFDSMYLNLIAKPIFNTWIARKEKMGSDLIFSHMSICKCPALRLACNFWMEKRDGY